MKARKILNIGKEDSYYVDRKILIGLYVKDIEEVISFKSGYISCYCKPIDTNFLKPASHDGKICFWHVKLKKEEEIEI